ncbi:N-6 DNA methylase [Synechococcus sp. CC9616]|uniref:Eco57I restriction-modification methylase domain-containing protein n=1 Tax=Synechococcus sp. CC9616 TaxID=110663 RepID=UPI00048EFA4F|nr:N-6 DNA methylase [Synechococcus sp. CC9616]
MSKPHCEPQKDVFNSFANGISTCKSEQDVRELFSRTIYPSLGIPEPLAKHVKHAFTIPRGELDSLYGKLIIEFKAPGEIPLQASSPKLAEQYNQVEKYIKGISRIEQLDDQEIPGILFDGKTISFISLINGAIASDGPHKFDFYYFKRLVEKIFYGLTSPKALTSKNLISDFSCQSTTTKQAIQALYTLTTGFENERSKLLFSQWKTYFQEICGYEFKPQKNLNRVLEADYGITDPVIEKLIFSIHTYFTIITTLLSIKLGSIFSPAFNSEYWLKSTQEGATEASWRKIFTNQPFAEVGFINLIEPLFFDWFLDEDFDNINQIIASISSSISSYTSETLNLNQVGERDILKDLYESLSPPELRHALGEYYTPDWLVDQTLSRADYKPMQGEITIDPACGSGSFLMAAIKKYKHINQPHKRDLCLSILHDIKGIDLNPLAVASSKLNYLIAIGSELLRSTAGEDIEIPVYMSDSMLSPIEYKFEESECFIVPTKACNFRLSKKHVENAGFQISMNVLQSSIKNKDSLELFNAKILSNTRFSQTEVSEFLHPLHQELEELEKQGLDGIWAGIIKNFFAPSFMGKAKYIIGNPPWINWENLPEAYRDSIKQYWSEYAYNLFRIKGFNARLGSAHDDICVLMTYIVSDTLLKFDGTIAFILPQTLFKSKGGGDGFRGFEIKDNFYLDVQSVDDMASIKPFDAANKTSIFIAKKSKKPTSYPVRYIKWVKKKGGGLRKTDNLNTIIGKTLCTEQVAIPIDKKNISSPWLSGESSTVFQLRSLVGNSTYRARKGVDTSLNQIFWVKINSTKGNLSEISNCQSRGRSQVRKKEGVWIESQSLYPLLRGSNFRKWKYSTELYQILLYDHMTGKPLNEVDAQMQAPKAVRYFDDIDYKNLLQNRAIYRQHLKGKPHYSCFDIGKYTFAENKVVWKALATGMEACVINRDQEDRLIIPDHNVLMIPTETEKEAHYLCGVLNSDLCTAFVKSYIEWFFSAHILEYFAIPKFNQSNTLHIDIANLSESAHQAESDSVLNLIEQDLNSLTKKLFKVEKTFK